MGFKSFARKLLICMLTGVVGAYANFELCRLVFTPWLYVVNSISLSLFLASVAYPVLWQYREYKGRADSAAIYERWRSGLSFFIAIDLCMFACRKLFHLQFNAPDALLDKAVSSMTGQQLTIAYFSHSYAFAICIASCQIAGSLLLLCSRTRLVGVFVLLPVVANIILIDVFYDVDEGALVQCCALMAGVLYFLFSEYGRLAVFFFQRKEGEERSGHILTHAWKAAAILIPVAFCIILYDQPHRHPALTGKYEVQKLILNSHEEDVAGCSGVYLKQVYIDDHHDIVLKGTGANKWLMGHFSLDKKTGGLTVVWLRPESYHDTLVATIRPMTKDSMFLLSGVMGRDTISAEMLKVK